MQLASTDKLRIVLAGAVTTNQAALVAAYVDIADDASTAAPAPTSTTTNSTTIVDWVGSPASGKRQIKYLSLYNADTVSITATVSYYDGTNTRTLVKVTLATTERLEFVDSTGFRVLSASGAPKSSVALPDGDYGDVVVSGFGTVMSLDATAGTGRHAVYIAAGSMSPSATGGCAALATIASAANQPDIQALDFDTTTQEYCQFGIKMPESWDEGTITFRPVWSHASTSTNFGVVWDLQAVAVSDDDAIAVAFGTAQTSTDTGGTTNDIYIGPESSAITVGGSPAAGDMVFFRGSRVTGNGSDTMAIDARLHGYVVYMYTNARTD